MNFKDKRYYAQKTKEVLGVIVVSALFVALVAFMAYMA